MTMGAWIPAFAGMTMDVWIPVPVPDSDPGFAGMTALTYIVAGVINPDILLNPSNIMLQSAGK
jgi:hypothetical protein